MKRRLFILFIFGFLTCLDVEAYSLYSEYKILDPVNMQTSGQSVLTYEEINNAVSAGEAVMLCEYTPPNTQTGIKIYYRFAETQYSSNNSYWYFFKTDDQQKWKYLVGGPFNETFKKNGNVHYNETDQILASENDFNGCTPNAFIDTDSWQQEICLDTDDDCGKKFDTGKKEMLTLNVNSVTIYNDIHAFASTEVYDNITYDEYAANDDLLSLVLTKTEDYIRNKYFNTTYHFPDFILNYIKTLNDGDKLINSEKFENFKNKMIAEVNKRLANGDITEEEANKMTDRLNTDPIEALNIKDNTLIELPDSTENTCEGLLGEQFSEYLHNIFITIQYLGPVLVAVLTIIDFIKTALSGERENLQKDFKRFTQRIIYAMLLFFVPLIVNLILSVTGVIVPSKCF